MPSSLLSALLPPPSSSSSLQRQRPESTGSTTYDQKQSGKYNIHLNIKDVSIIALDAGSLDSGVGDFGEDYYEDYDLSDFTVKPIFGIIDIATPKPIPATNATSTTTKVPSLLHDETDDSPFSTSSNDSKPSTSKPGNFNPDNLKPDLWTLFLNSEEFQAIKDKDKEPIIKNPSTTVKIPDPSVGLIQPNKTQSVVIISQHTTPSVSILSLNDSSSGIIVTTPTPSPESLPPKPSLADIANISTLQAASKPTLIQPIIANAAVSQPLKPNEIPVQIILEQPTHQHIGHRRNRPNHANHGNWRFKNRFRATPSHNRRITPPHITNTNDEHNEKIVFGVPAADRYKLRRNAMHIENRRNCVHDSNGNCIDTSRRLGSPLL